MTRSHQQKPGLEQRLIEAVRICKQRNVAFKTAFRLQYLVSEDGTLNLPMTRTAIGRWTVYSGSGLGLATLRDRAGVAFAVLLGIAVDETGLIGTEHRVMTLDTHAPSFFDDFEAWLKPVAGRYTIVLNAAESSRIYCDPVGMNGVVYEPSIRQVASSTLLCLNRPVIEHPLYDHQINETEGGKYTLFHTRDAHVRRMNPNAWLDLDDFSEHRFWPRNETFDTPMSALGDIYDEITQRARHSIAAIVGGPFKTSLPMSGGQDSRLLAVLAGPSMKKIDQVYSHINNYVGRIDAGVARSVCRQIGRRHEIHDRKRVKPDPDQIDESTRYFQTAAGVVTPIPDELRTGVVERLLPGSVMLRGHQTDLLRGVFLDRLGARGRENFVWQIKRLLIVPRKKFTLDIYQRFLPEYQTWYDSLPQTARHKSVDFMFVEVYYSASLGVTFPGLHRNFYMSPFNSRRLIELCISIDDTYRRASDAVNDLVLRLNEKVHDVPFDFEVGADLARLDDAEFWRERCHDRMAASRERRKLIKPPSVEAGGSTRQAPIQEVAGS